MQINFLDNLIEADEDEQIVPDPIHGLLYPGEALHFLYENDKLTEVNYVRKNIF
ncbi:MAG: hypothetical protein ABIH67_00335 [Candidatus Uhrbacteria bacterium]